jgi:hypothetical protein
MKLSNKYGVPQSTLDQMVKDGIISSKWPEYEEVYGLYLKMKSSGKSKEQICHDIADQRNMNWTTVKHMISIVDKI